MSMRCSHCCLADRLAISVDLFTEIWCLISDDTIIMGLALSSQKTHIGAFIVLCIIDILGNLNILDIGQCIIVDNLMVMFNSILRYVKILVPVFVINHLSLVVNILEKISWSPLGLIDILDR